MEYIGRCTLLLIYILTVILFSTTEATAEQSCSSDSECELYGNNTICSPNGCAGNICQCKVGYSMYPPQKDCIKVSLIGETCDQTIKCRPHNSICKTTTTCECKSGYGPTSDKFRCVNNTYTLLGENCGTGDKCTYKTECVNGTCMCESGYKPWDDISQWYGIPHSLDMECTNLNHTLDKCNGSTIVPVLHVTTELSSTPDTASVTTSTTEISSSSTEISSSTTEISSPTTDISSSTTDISSSSTDISSSTTDISSSTTEISSPTTDISSSTTDISSSTTDISSSSTEISSPTTGISSSTTDISSSSTEISSPTAKISSPTTEISSSTTETSTPTTDASTLTAASTTESPAPKIHMTTEQATVPFRSTATSATPTTVEYSSTIEQSSTQLHQSNPTTEYTYSSYSLTPSSTPWTTKQLTTHQGTHKIGTVSDSSSSATLLVGKTTSSSLSSLLLSQGSPLYSLSGTSAVISTTNETTTNVPVSSTVSELSNETTTVFDVSSTDNQIPDKTTTNAKAASTSVADMSHSSLSHSHVVLTSTPDLSSNGDSNRQERKDFPKEAVIIPSVLAGVFLLVIILVLIVGCWRRRRQRELDNESLASKEDNVPTENNHVSSREYVDMGNPIPRPRLYMPTHNSSLPGYNGFNGVRSASIPADGMAPVLIRPAMSSSRGMWAPVSMDPYRFYDEHRKTSI